MNIFMITYSVIMVGLSGLEPPTSRLSGARSNLLSYKPIFTRCASSFHLFPKRDLQFAKQIAIACRCLPTGGDDGIRTHDPLLAGQVLSQLSYTPIGVFCCYLRTYWRMIILQNWTTNDVYAESRRPWLIIYFRITQNSIEFCRFSIERRWSSRTFRYGYLVTT